MKIADLPKEAKPREKAFCYGINELSDDELLALIIGSGVKGHSAIEISKSLLKTFISLPELSSASLNALQKTKGLSRITALKLVACFEIHKRLISPKYLEHETIQNTLQIYDRFKYLENYDHEVFVLLMLNRKREIIRELCKYRGTAQSINFDFKEIILDLLDSKCHYFVLIHNHPDGANKPSENDVISTFIIKEKAEEFGIKILDHVIIYKNGYYSFNENHHFD